MHRRVLGLVGDGIPLDLLLQTALPTLLQFEADHQKMQALVTENSLLHTQLANTRESLTEAELNLQKVEARLAQQVAQQTTTAR